MELHTDASSCGFGAYYAGVWLTGSWDSEQAAQSITYQELYAVVIAASTWGFQWQKRRVLFHCDNEAVVAVLRSGTSRSTSVMQLLRCLFFVCAQHNFTLSAQHVAGTANSVADSLSRHQMERFRQLAPEAAAAPSAIQPLPTLN